MGADLRARRARAERAALVAGLAWFAGSLVATAQIANHTTAPDWVGGAVPVAGMFTAVAIAWATYRLVVGADAAEIRAQVVAEAQARDAAAARAARARTEHAALLQAEELRRREEHQRREQTPGTEEWRRRQAAIRRQRVYDETHVVWKPEYYSAAPTSNIRRARALMRSLEQEDRKVERAAAQAKIDRRLRRGSISTPRAAELAMTDWLRKHGHPDAAVCPPGTDGGIDIESALAVAQVKLWRTNKVGRPIVQQLRGAAGERLAIVFAFESGGFSDPAVRWADDEDVALLLYDENGEVTDALTQAGHDLCAAITPAGVNGTATRTQVIKKVAEWMANQGLPDVATSPSGSPDGPDILADGAAAFVKPWRTNRVSATVVDRCAEVAAGRTCLVFAHQAAGFTSPATERADERGVALFLVDDNGTIRQAANSAARRIEAAGTMWRQ